ncbi:ABC transporter ATP-binding protein [Streptomyces sp. ITFR-6]|uniref:ABC transporter ATP-binding protein n=1 Tax=Streptomyces sp. ITFR-6 TaxID=3075197 RepID=UPI00288B0484|nr:ABC transporter ATP-binding protein [Streptomyces sp. ITFR-6]WNI31735.1 ABC transporter ATP-binding protein [Streptomyces sp. ITFR-6]
MTGGATAVRSGIRFDRVSVAYGGNTVLDGLDLTVEPGEVMALLGPSGSGRTTALRAVAGFVRPASGRVYIGDRDVTALPPHKRGIGMVVQSYALFPHLRVQDNVAFGLKAQKADRSEVPDRGAEALELVGMAGYARRYPRELSGGQQQRVAIARAIRPGVLLLDEPLSALDAQLRSGMLTELARLHRELPVAKTGDTVDFAGHALAVPTGEVAEGVTATLCVRPHLVGLGAGPNALTGTISEVQWRGSTHRLYVDVGGHRIKADVRELRETPALGNAVTLHFAAQDAVLLPAGAGDAHG